MADHKNDISIDKNQWIRWLDIDKTTESYCIDDLLVPTIEFWYELQTECVVECCGIDAFGFWPKDIESAKLKFDHQKLSSDLQTLRSKIIASKSEVLNSSFLNNYFDQSVFIKLIDHILANL